MRLNEEEVDREPQGTKTSVRALPLRFTVIVPGDYEINEKLEIRRVR
jgi:hypothetical protein